MIKTNIKLIAKQVAYALVGVVTMLAYFPSIASASAITTRSVVMGSSVGGALTTYSFTFTAAQATTIKSVSFAGCTTATGACTPASGFANPNASALDSSSNLGSGGSWTVDTSTTGELRMKNTSNTGAPSAGITAVFKNPTATNATFYLRITTFSDDAWTTSIDTGTIAASTAEQITVTANVDETLTFTLTSATVALGSLTSGTTGTGVSTMSASTNAASGYTISYKGTTLGGPTTITAMGTLAASSTNSKQFGINLAANTSPSVTGSAAPSGGSGVATAGVYDVANEFKFNTAGEAVAGATAPTNTTTYKVSYIANIDGSTPAGAYSTVLTYTATANF